MLFRSISTILLYILFQNTVLAAKCLDVFPAAYNQATSVNEQLTNFPANNSSANIANGTILSRGDNYYSGSSLDNKDQVSVAAISGSETTARLFFRNSVSWKNVKINQNGNPEDLIIVVGGSLSITGGSTDINAIIYVKGSLAIKGAKGKGAFTSVGSGSSDTTYNTNYIETADFNGMCDNTPLAPVTPIVDYRFDECSYTGAGFEIIDQTGNFNASIHGINESANEAQINKSLDLSSNSTRDWVSVPSGVVNGLNDFTLSVWINTDKKKNQQEIFHALGSSTRDDELEIYLKKDKEVSVKIQGESTNLKGNIVLTDGEWHHILITRVSDQVCLYVDGNNQDCDTGVGRGQLSVPYSNSIVIGQEQDSYGGRFSASQSFEGLMDELKIYDQVLSSTSISNLYSNELASNNADGTSRDAVNCSPVPIAEYRFDECSYDGSAFEVIDQSGNFSAQSFANLNTSNDAQIVRAADISAAEHYIETSIPIIGNSSVATWFKKPSINGGNRYLVLGAMPNGGDLLYLDSFNDYRWGVYDGNISVEGNFWFADLTNGWHHMVLVYNNNTTSLYIDGALVDMVALRPSGNLQYIGTSFDDINTNTPQGFRTPLDEFKVYDQTLSSAEITTLYTNELAKNNYDGSLRSTAECSELIAQFSMDEVIWDGSTGEVVDQTDNFNASALNGVTTAGSLPALSGNPGTCRYGSFDGIDDYIQINDDNRLDLQSELSISVWINPKVLPSSGLKTIISKDENYEFHLQPSGDIFWWWQTHSFSTTGAGIEAGNWYHIAITYKSGRQVIYVNGVEKGSRTFTDNLTLNNDPLQIGQDQGSSSRFFEGYIDEVHLYNGALTAIEVNELYTKRQACETIHHFEINHDAQGLTCIGEPLTIKACIDEACTDTIATPTDVKIFANGVLKTTITVTGKTDTSFSHLVEETITLSSDQNYTCRNGASTSCDINFANAGFLLDINSGVDVSSCESVNFDIKAVKLSDSGVSCAPAFTGNQNLDFSFSYSNPTTGTKLPLLNGTNMANTGESQTRNISFNANGGASIPIEYNDAGALSFTVSEKVSSGVTSATLIKDFFPSKLVMVAKKTNGTFLNNSSAAGEPKQVAAEGFSLSFTGQCNNNTDTPNYQPQSDSVVVLALRQIAPSSSTSVLGQLSLGTSTIDASNATDTRWQAINTAEKELVASYDEVGIISVNVKDNDYLGNEITTLSFLDVGRFTPSYFDVFVTDNSFENACSLDINTFTYIGQPFSYLNAPILTITAKNALGVKTQNYTESTFQKLIVNNVSRTFPLADSSKNEVDKDGNDLVTKMVVEPTTFAGDLSKLSNGILDYNFSPADTFTYSKGSYSQVAEFTVDYNILINSITDSDNVAINLATTLPLTVKPSGGFQRFGRLVLGNSFGAETSAIAQYFQVEYLNASRTFVVNTDDNCSLVTNNTSNWSFSNPTNNVTINGINIRGTSGSLNEGKFQNVLLTSGNNQGSIGVEYTTQDWLKFDWLNEDNNFDGPYHQNPTATVIFGIYRGNDRIISWREIGN
ncbi:DUF6701 domain-containing protein [Colwellia hornerae]|nr:DUF6701 domain-containing protein [Colwellia hornerae]